MCQPYDLPHLWPAPPPSPCYCRYNISKLCLDFNEAITGGASVLHNMSLRHRSAVSLYSPRHHLTRILTRTRSTLFTTGVGRGADTFGRVSVFDTSTLHHVRASLDQAHPQPSVSMEFTKGSSASLNGTSAPEPHVEVWAGGRAGGRGGCPLEEGVVGFVERDGIAGSPALTCGRAGGVAVHDGGACVHTCGMEGPWGRAGRCVWGDCRCYWCCRRMHEHGAHARTYMYTHAHTHTCTHARTHASTHTHTRTHERVHTCTHTHARTNAHTYTRTHTCTHMRTHAHTNAYIHVHTHTHARTHTRTHERVHTRTHTRTHAHRLMHNHTHCIDAWPCTHAPPHTHRVQVSVPVHGHSWQHPAVPGHAAGLPV